MSREPEIFIAPCSREYKTQTFRHFQNKVIDGVDTDEYPAIKRSGFDGKIGTWGVVSGNKTHWERLTTGDVILFYTESGVYTHLAEVVDTDYNETLGDDLWKTYDGNRLVNDLEEPWPYLIYLSNVQRVDIPADELHGALDYSMDYPQGFMRPTDKRQKTLKNKHGSVEGFLQQYTTTSLSGSILNINETLDRLNAKLNKEPELKAEKTHTRTQQIVRSSAFRRKIYDIYDETCVVCGARRASPDGYPEIEAAHIYPKSEDGNDDIRNGLGLCKLHHWAFGVGWLSIADDYDLLVKDARQRQGFEEFNRLSGQRIRLPENERLRPHPKFLRAHRSIHEFGET